MKYTPAALSALFFSLAWPALAEPQLATQEGARHIPEYSLPVPAHVSAQLQEAIRNAQAGDAGIAVPASAEQWRAYAASMESEQARQARENLLKSLAVTMQRQTIAAVPSYLLTPSDMPTENRHRSFVFLHGGGYVIGAGESGTYEAIILAHRLRMKVLAIDYRMPPDHPFPAALDDSVAVYKELLSGGRPANIALGGSSAGGGLALAVVMRLRELGLPLPGAVFAGTPWVDLSNGGDSMHTNQHVDSVLAGTRAWMLAQGRLYAGTHDVRAPLISPVFGDFAGFPATFLLTGTRDLLLSDTVRAHRKLRAAGVDAQLHVFEALSHIEYVILDQSPESRDAYVELAAFLDRHLGSAHYERKDR
jgi:acetyl esterase/lipase